MEQNITFRPITPADEPFLYRLYASTREDELSVLPWSAAEKEVFLTMQFNAQHKFYQEQFKRADFDLVLCNGEPIGRLYLDCRKDEFRIIDIALLPEHRRRGIGSRLLKKILADAKTAVLPVRIHVEHNNPALNLYHRLGFRQIGDEGVYLLMECPPDAR